MIIQQYEFIKSETAKYRYTVLVTKEIVNRYVILAPWEQVFNGGTIFQTAAEAAKALCHWGIFPAGSRIDVIEHVETVYQSKKYRRG